MKEVKTLAKDLTKDLPRSPYTRIGEFAILGRTIDKCRSSLAGMEGEYLFNDPLDRKLFVFKGLDADEFKNYVATGASDEEIGEWVNKNGLPKTFGEIKGWSDSLNVRFGGIIKADRETYEHKKEEVIVEEYKPQKFYID